jgi:hypothetical protein
MTHVRTLPREPGVFWGALLRGFLTAGGLTDRAIHVQDHFADWPAGMNLLDRPSTHVRESIEVACLCQHLRLESPDLVG